ncbi:MAG: serine/threonine protein kinase [Gemmatimonadetes bacterium]|nr:serine/threonine protein kinase [Gemmatimonadota bacterium]
MPAPATPEFLLLQQALAGRYSLERELGRGGMGIVFLARDVALDRPVAIKLLPPALAQQPDLRERFLREARTAARLSHPNIVPIHLVEARDDLVYFVMAFVDGETLGQRVRRGGALGTAQATRVIQEVAWALAYAHGRGVVHRDVKPDNILLDKDSGRAMVTDFGIARLAEASPLTGAGELMGTTHYMSPEALSGKDQDGRSDLFSLGVTAYYALTALLPFEGPTLPAVIARILTEDPPRLALQRKEIPPRLAEAVERCLAKDAAARFASGEELAEAVGTVDSVGESAPQIRYLLKVSHELDTAFGMVILGGLVIPPLVSALWATQPQTVLLVSFILGAQVVLAPLATVNAAREAIRAGLGYADLRRALDRAAKATREESEVLGFTDSPQSLVKRRGDWKRIGHVGVALGFLGVLAPNIPGVADTGNWLRAFGVASFAVGALCYGASFALRFVSATRVRLTSAHAGSQGGEWLLGTWLGKWLFRLAGIGLRSKAQNQPPSAERTEVVLALAAGDLFGRLPTDLKRRFGEVPELIHRLEREAERLRTREAHLGHALATAGSGSSERQRGVLMELEGAKADVRARLGTAVAALENIRLDLLKLEAGVGSADDLTAAVEQARAIGDAVEGELKARREVRDLLSETT